MSCHVGLFQWLLLRNMAALFPLEGVPVLGAEAFVWSSDTSITSRRPCRDIAKGGVEAGTGREDG